MSETDQFHFEFPVWNSACEHAGRQNADRLAEQARRRPAMLADSATLPPVQRVGICGAGIMGAGIAAANVLHGVPVRLYDAAPEAMERTRSQLLSEFGSPNSADPASASPQLVVTSEHQNELADCDLVIESVVENRELKQQILIQLAHTLSPHAILTTNTSTIPVRELAAVLPDPSRFCGLHFCNPVSQRSLVEIVRGPLTSDRTVAAAVSYVARIGKLPIVVQDSPGFLVNRLLLPYLNEALEMICQGADLLQIDNAARAFGMALGPIEFFDTIGTDTAMWAGRTLWEAFPDRIALTPVLPALVKRNRLGQKTGAGFYRYDGSDGRGRVDPDVAPILAPYNRRVHRFSPQEITMRLFLPMLVEATRAIEEEVVQDVRDVDVGLLYGLAFPQARGGLLYWADSVGAAAIVDWLQPFLSLGKRMHPTPLLLNMARTGERFYAPED